MEEKFITRFNPYFNGLSILTKPYGKVLSYRCGVSILILMDYQFLQENKDLGDDKMKVSILILMDYQFLLIDDHELEIYYWRFQSLF